MYLKNRFHYIHLIVISFVSFYKSIFVIIMEKYNFF